MIERIFVANPADRITIPEIKKHAWFAKNLPAHLRQVGWPWAITDCFPNL